MPVKYEFIVNPQARSGKGQLIWDLLEPELKKQKIRYRVYLTERRRHAERIAGELTEDDREHRIVVLGGDGTVNEVINGIRYLSRVTLGCIPTGSGNDLARGLGISYDPSAALNAVLHPEKVISMDVGTVRMGKRTRRFAVSTGIGFDAAVCHEVCVSHWKKLCNRIGMGRLSYLAVAIDRLCREQTFRLKLTLEDGREQVFEKTYFAAVMNLPCEGGGFRFCPDADPEDGALDLILVSGLSRLRLLSLLPAALVGKHVGARGVWMTRCRKAVVETDRPVAVHTDGEPIFLRKRILPEIGSEKLRVIVR